MRRAAQSAAANRVIQNGIGDEHLTGLDNAGDDNIAVGSGVVKDDGIEIVEFVGCAAVKPVHGAGVPRAAVGARPDERGRRLAGDVEQHGSGSRRVERKCLA